MITQRHIEIRDINSGMMMVSSFMPLCASKYECQQEALRLHNKLTSAWEDTYVVERLAIDRIIDCDVDRKYPATDLHNVML